MNARTVAAAFTIFMSTDIQMDLWNARIARFFREVINIFIDFSEYQISFMSIVDPFSEESERVQEGFHDMVFSPADIVENYFFGSVRYLKSNAKKMCQYKMQNGIAIFSKKLVFSNEGQKGEIQKICPILRNVFYGFIIFYYIYI